MLHTNLKTLQREGLGSMGLGGVLSNHVHSGGINVEPKEIKRRFTRLFFGKLRTTMEGGSHRETFKPGHRGATSW